MNTRFISLCLLLCSFHVSAQTTTPAPVAEYQDIELALPASRASRSMYGLAGVASTLTLTLVAGAVMWGVCDNSDSSGCNVVEDAGQALTITSASLLTAGGAAILGYQCYKESRRRR